MKAVFGIVSLLVVLSVVGLLASRQMKTASTVVTVAPAASAPLEANTPQQARQIQDQVRQDLNKALEQGARRNSDADQ
ncbi:MAG: hypothetical protein ABW190_10255 [Rhizobacter sp.]